MRIHSIRFLISIVLFALTWTAFAQAPLSAKKGSSLTVEAFEEKTGLFWVSFRGEAAGPHYVTPENLRKAIAFEGSQADFMKQKAQMTGSIYELKYPLPILSEQEVLKRVKKVVKEENSGK